MYRKRFDFIDQWSGAAASLTHNGKPVGEALLPPLSFPVQGLLEQDTNRVEITLYGTLANTFGPIHLHNRSRLPMIGPMLIADMTRYNEAPELVRFRSGVVVPAWRRKK